MRSIEDNFKLAARAPRRGRATPGSGKPLSGASGRDSTRFCFVVSRGASRRGPRRFRRGGWCSPGSGRGGSWGDHRATSARVGWMEWGGDAGAGRGRVRRQLGAEDAAAGAVARAGAAEGHAVGAAAVDADVRRITRRWSFRGAAGGHGRRRPRAGDLGRRQRLGAGGHPAGAGLSRDAVRRDHRQSGADAERVAARDRDARQVQRRDPHAREPGALQRHERLHHRRVPDPRDLRGDVPGAARVALHLAGRGLRVFRLRLAGHVGDAARRPVHGGGADRVPLRQLRQRRDDQRRLRLSGDGVRLDHDSAADRFERADPGGDARLRRRARGAVAELRAVGQSVSHAAAPPRRRQLGDARACSWASGTRTSASRSTISFCPTTSTPAGRSG